MNDPFDYMTVGISGNINKGYLEIFIDILSQVNPIHGTLEQVVNENHIRGCCFNKPDGIFTAFCTSTQLVPIFFYKKGKNGAYIRVIFNN